MAWLRIPFDTANVSVWLVTHAVNAKRHDEEDFDQKTEDGVSSIRPLPVK